MGRSIPYGYRIEDGQAVVDEEQAARIREFFNAYISGMALTVAAETAGLKLHHGCAGRMLRNKRYLGDAYYPAIIDKEIFDKAEEKRMEKARSLGRIRELKDHKMPECLMKFKMPKVIDKFSDPFKQAEYAYSLIESEVEVSDGIK
ncbi:MAG: recombinase [Acetobacterium sp.]|nr:recombinase [Acetobacterium sp.]